MKNKFKKMQELALETQCLEEKFYKKQYQLEIERKSIVDEIIRHKLKSLKISIGDKVEDSVYENSAFLVDVFFRQKPSTYLKKSDDITFEDFEFVGEYRNIKQDGTIGKQEALGIFKINNLVEKDIFL